MWRWRRRVRRMRGLMRSVEALAGSLARCAAALERLAPAEPAAPARPDPIQSIEEVYTGQGTLAGLALLEAEWARAHRGPLADREAWAELQRRGWVPFVDDRTG